MCICVNALRLHLICYSVFAVSSTSFLLASIGALFLLKSTLFSTVHSYSQGTWVSSTGLTVSSHRSRGSIPHQIPPGLCHRLITLARGCQDNRAKDSTPLACPWASTTRSVPPYVLLYCLPYHAASTRKKHYVEVDTN